MKPATLRTSEHDSECPHCGEPFRARSVAWIRMGTYACHRCRQTFSIFGSNYFNEHGIAMPTWNGEPLEGTH